MRTIFIGSSTESLPIAETMAGALSRKRFRPLLWTEIFKSGDVTLDKIAAVAEEVDAAVLVWSADDGLWYRGEDRQVARDNCVLEYGIFLAKLGRQRTAVFAREGVKLPTDVSGITVKFFGANVETAARELATDLDHQAKKSSPPIVPVHADEQVWQALNARDLPGDWISRSLYVKYEGAQNWRILANDPNYPLSFIGDTFGFRPLLTKALGAIDAIEIEKIGLIVSLGPGDGRHEEFVVGALNGVCQSSSEWIPVDVSHGLLSHVVHRYQKAMAVDRAILGDYESGLPFIFSKVWTGNTPRPKLLVTMFGGGFGNLDLGEQAFLTNLISQLNDGDLLLLDFAVKGDAWSQATDIRADPSKYAPAFKRLLLHGLAARMHRDTADYLNDRLKVDHIDAHAGPGGSDVQGAHTVQIGHEDTGLPLLRLRRFEWEKTVQWFKDKPALRVLFADRTDRATDRADVMRMGLVLLEKK